MILGIKAPKKKCEDKKCPFHGTLNVKKKSFSGVVVSAKMHNTITLEIKRRVYVPKYERYVKKKTRIHAHNPECIETEEGDVVRVFQTRPLSKTVNFVVLENLGKQKHYEEIKEALEEGKVQQEESKEETEEEDESTEQQDN